METNIKIIKGALIKSGLLRIYTKAYRKAVRFKDYKEMDIVAQYMSCEQMDACDAINASRWGRWKRARKRIESMMPKKPIFCTLTFNNETLETTTREQRRNLVARYLKEHCTEYLANIDFGKENEREHYHAVCIAKTGSMPREPWAKYGNPDFKRVHRTESAGRLAKYINKFTAHAFKESTETNGLPRLIYSRS